MIFKRALFFSVEPLIRPIKKKNPQTHRAAKKDRAILLNEKLLDLKKEELRKSLTSRTHFGPCTKEIEQIELNKENIVRRHIYGYPSHIGYDHRQTYPGHPVNFDCVRPIPELCWDSQLSRAARETPLQSRENLYNERVIRPRYMRPCRGTPLQEYQDGMVEGVRIRPVFNPYVKRDGYISAKLDYWNSRNPEEWSPFSCSLRGGRKRYDIPADLLPQKDELGEWIKPKISSRYQADIRFQYHMHSIPYLWDRFSRWSMNRGVHFADREPIGQKYWYRKQFRDARTKEAMKNLPQLLDDYRVERYKAKKHSWFEKIILDLVGEENAREFVKPREIPKLASN